jgi:transposase-like protein
MEGMAYTLTTCPTCRSLKVTLTLGTSSANYRRCDACGDMWTERLSGSARGRADDDAGPPAPSPEPPARDCRA